MQVHSVSASARSTIDSAAPEQRKRTIWRLVTLVLVAYWLTLITATHIPHVPDPLRILPSDKLLHFAAYAVLGTLVGLAWSLRWVLGWRAVLGLWLPLAVHGALDEVTQPYFGRHAETSDWYADIGGAAAGLAAVAAAQWCWRRMRAERS